MVSINLKHSKTDQERKGMKIIISKVKNDLSAISVMLNFLKVRGSYLGPLFCRKSGTPLLKSRFVDCVGSALSKANLPAYVFTGHRFVQELQQPQLLLASVIPLFSLQGFGIVILTFCTSEFNTKIWQKFPHPCTVCVCKF